jgi:hypothetical protein
LPATRQLRGRPVGPPEEFAATIARDSAKWADVVKRAGVKLD